MCPNVLDTLQYLAKNGTSVPDTVSSTINLCTRGQDSHKRENTPWEEAAAVHSRDTKCSDACGDVREAGPPHLTLRGGAATVSYRAAPLHAITVKRASSGKMRGKWCFLFHNCLRLNDFRSFALNLGTWYKYSTAKLKYIRM